MSENIRLNYLKGTLFALMGPAIGIALWVIVWFMGFIASIVAFAMAWLTVWGFRRGAGGIDKQSVRIIISLIFVGLLLAFYATFTLDTAFYLQSDVEGFKGLGILDILSMGNFWSANNSDFINPSVISGYAGDIAFSILLGGLGVYTTIGSVLAEGRGEKEGKEGKATTTPVKAIEAKNLKNPWVALTLNVFPGLGYLYLNIRRVLGWMLLISNALFLMVVVISWNAPVAEANPAADSLSALSALVMYVAFIIDGYFEAKRINKASEK